MFLHRWHKAEAKVVLAKLNVAGGTALGRAMDFVVDVRTQDGRFFRAQIHEPVLWADFWPPTEGHIVGVEVEGESENVRFDKADPRLSTREHDRMKRSEVDAVLAQPPGSDPNHPWDAAEPRDQGGVTAGHPEWNHTRGMHNAGHQEPPKHDLP